MITLNSVNAGTLLVSRVLHRAFERLEPDEAKVSRPVLRGGGGSNTASLPGAAEGTRREAAMLSYGEGALPYPPFPLTFFSAAHTLSLVIAHILCSSKKVMWERLDG